MSGYDRGMPPAAPGYGGYPQGEHGDRQQLQQEQQLRHPEQMHNQQGHQPGDQHQQQQYPQHQSMENMPDDARAQGDKPEARKLPSLWLEAWQVRRPQPRARLTFDSAFP